MANLKCLSRIIVDRESPESNFSRYIAEPFDKGFGHTIGNSLRRVALTSLESPAIVSVRIEGIPHEYMAIEGIVEDMTNIILNFKGALLRKLPTDDVPNMSRYANVNQIIGSDSRRFRSQQGQYRVTLGDVIQEGYFEVVNPELTSYLQSPGLCVVKLIFACRFWAGYVPSERHV